MRRLLAAFSGPLGRPGGPAIVGFGFIGRAPMAMMPVALVASAAVADQDTGYAIGGAAAGAYAVATAVVGPIVGRFADRNGQVPLVRVLVIAAAAVAVLLIASLVVLGASPLLIPLAALMGAAQPNVGAFTRARWAALPDPATTGESAQALESINDESSFLVGPAAVPLLAATGVVGLSIAVPMALAVIGAFGITSRLSLPAPAPHPTAHAGSWRPSFPAGAGVLLAVGAMGGALGAIQVLQLAYSAAIGQAEGAAVVYFVYSLASLVGAILVGARTWRTPVRRRFTIALVIFAFGVIPSVVVTGYWPFVLASLVSGAAIAATFIQSNALVAEVTPAYARTSSFAILVSGTAIGIAVGAAVAGSATTAVGADAARLVILPLAFLAAGIAIVGEAIATRRGPGAISATGG